MTNRHQPIDYEMKIYAYLDLLGFKDVVGDADNNPNGVEKIYNLLRSRKLLKSVLSIMPPDPKLDRNKFEVRGFSDTVTVSCPIEPHAYFEAMSRLVIFYQYLLCEKHKKFLRGAIVCEKIYEDEEVVFGPALIRAHYLAENLADWPRVLVDESILNGSTPEQTERCFAKFLRKDDRGQVHLDYLRPYFAVSGLPDFRVKGYVGDLRSPLGPFQIHKTTIEAEVRNLIEKRKTDVCEEKYKPLANYHNLAIDHQCNVIRMLRSDEGAITNSALAMCTRHENTYTADNQDYADVTYLVGKCLRRIHEMHEQVYDPADTLDRKIALVSQRILSHLSKLEDELRSLKIDIQSLLG